jgi:hypothetical protein
MNTQTRTTFDVSNVKPEREPLPEVEFIDAVRTQVSPGRFVNARKKTHEKLRQSPPPDQPDSPRSGAVEACSRYHGRLLQRVAYHPVVAACHRAFMYHRPLCLSPDMICQGVANHINVHAEELRSRFARRQTNVKMEVRRDDFVKGSPENPWAEVFNDFSVQIRDHIGPKIELFVRSFSTTRMER